MFTTFQRAASAAASVLAVLSFPAFAITGGISVDDVLAAAGKGRYNEQQTTLAHAISTVTVQLLRLDAGGRSKGACSSTIIHPRVVLTAAHCVVDEKQESGRMQVLFDGGNVRREVLDVAIHPEFLKLVQGAGHNPGKTDMRQFLRGRTEDFIHSDLALVLLHRPIPVNYAVLAPVPAGFRDARATRKFIAGYGRTDVAGVAGKQVLHFAEMQGNTSLEEDTLGEEGGIVMESRYRDGARTNVCRGDSGGPVLVVSQSSPTPRQLGVTSASDKNCRQTAVFSSINGQRPVLRDMFNSLMDGEQGAEKNPF